MKTSLSLGISSISISVIFWGLILYTNLVMGDDATAIALGLGWFFLGCPVILTLSIASLVTAFRKPKPILGMNQGVAAVQPMKTAKIISVISAACFVIPFIVGTVIVPIMNG